MPRPAVLLVEPDPGVRKALGTGLARYGYEVIPAVSTAEGERFAARLGPAVVVASAALPGYGDGTILERWSDEATGVERTLVLLGDGGADPGSLPLAVRHVPVDGLASDEVVQKVRLVLLGREVGVETDPELEGLVGELERTPALELVRGLARARFTGRLEVPTGYVAFHEGEAAAAGAGAYGGYGHRRVHGVKAFCRLGRLGQGTFRVRPGETTAVPPLEECIEQRLEHLVIRAVEEAVGEYPHPRSRLLVEMGPAFFAARFSALEQQVLSTAQHGATAGALFDGLAETDGEVLATVGSLVERGLMMVGEPEAHCYVVTDSSADLPGEVAHAHGIRVVPLSVTFGEVVFRDGEDLRPRDFYERLAAGGDHPFTAPPGPADFLRRYRELLPRRDVVSVHLSGKLSQTVDHARRAGAEALAQVASRPGADGHEPEAVELRVVDSGAVSLGLGMLAVFAARLAARDRTCAEIEARLLDLSERMAILFAVDTLEYLRRGGRIGAARAWIGKLLGIKPILGVVAGEVVPVDRVRGGRAAHPRILELMAGRVEGKGPLLAGIAHASAPVWADRLRGLVEGRFQVAEMLMAEMGPTVGTHAGPGTVGVAWLQPTPEELELLMPLEA
jgi:DegV family protein with EDD domain